MSVLRPRLNEWREVKARPVETNCVVRKDPRTVTAEAR